jgi:DNA-binding Lrp family transcriptional regulator
MNATDDISYWHDLDAEILEALTAGGAMDPVDLARTLGMSPAAVCSCVAMLTAEGKVRICAVEVTPPTLPCAKAA